MIKRFFRTDEFLEFKAAIVIVMIAVIASLALLVATQRTEPVTGRIDKLWTQSDGNRGDINYATLRLPNGDKRVIILYTLDFGVLEEGESCTFHLSRRSVAQSIDNCDRSKQ